MVYVEVDEAENSHIDGPFYGVGSRLQLTSCLKCLHVDCELASCCSTSNELLIDEFSTFRDSSQISYSKSNVNSSSWSLGLYSDYDRDGVLNKKKKQPESLEKRIIRRKSSRRKISDGTSAPRCSPKVAKLSPREPNSLSFTLSFLLEFFDKWNEFNGDRAEDAIKNNHSSNDENWIKEVCDNLANIGDNVYSPVLTPQYFDPSSSGTVGGVEEGPNIVQLVSILKLYGDKHNDEVKSHVGSLVGSTSYNSFKATLNEAIESDPNWKSIALTFQLGLLAIKSVSGCTESAKNIFKNTICYIEDTYSKWVKDQGGWESVAEDASSEVD